LRNQDTLEIVREEFGSSGVGPEGSHHLVGTVGWANPDAVKQGGQKNENNDRTFCRSPDRHRSRHACAARIKQSTEPATSHLQETPSCRLRLRSVECDASQRLEDRLSGSVRVRAQRTQGLGARRFQTGWWWWRW